MARTRIEVNITRYETATWEFDGVLTEDEALELVRMGDRDPLWSEVHEEELDPIDLTIARSDG
jgi:hypothetical protein